MKSKSNIQFLFITLLTICISCNNEVVTEKQEDLPPEENTSIEQDKEALYNYQTNKNIMLYRLIRYNNVEKKYYLDATDEDIRKLGITIEDHKGVQICVEQLNQINIECP